MRPAKLHNKLCSHYLKLVGVTMDDLNKGKVYPVVYVLIKVKIEANTSRIELLTFILQIENY